MVQYYTSVLKKYFVFKGRARRAEYWYFFLFNFIISIAFGIISTVIGDSNGILGSVYGLAVLIPGIAVSIRRLHDTDHSGWWLLIGAIPIVGTIVLIIFMVRDSHPGENRYGPNPKGVGLPSVISSVPPVPPSTPPPTPIV